ncbi:uncharacterized protein BROUX77_007382 [Berkeleyomyces rouxiae]|uniref:uncharacterized protein n=1 Tax=Berkeleyomyces rouxiae TaxID=2035830 RepID=UPI003B79D023
MSQPRGAARRQTQQIYELGQAGRKTGVILPDNGQRDENGLQPLDGLFSSPTKPDGSTPRAADRSAMGEQEMEIDQASSPGPSTVMRNRRSGASALPVSRSPVRTSLGSPALKNLRLSGRASGSLRLRTSDASPAASVPASAVNKGNPQAVSRNLFAVPKAHHMARPTAKPTSSSQPRRFMPISDDEEEEDDDDVLQPPTQGDIFDESMQMIEEFIPQSDAPQPFDDIPEEEPDPTPPRPTKRPARPPSQPAKKPDPPKPAARRSPLKRSRQVEDMYDSPPEEEEEEEEDPHGSASEGESPASLPPPRPPQRKTSRSAPPKTKPTATSSQPSAAGPAKSRTKPTPAQTANRRARVASRPKKTAASQSSAAAAHATSDTNEPADQSLLQVQRGPPPPKRRGLMSVHSNQTITTTRSGRSSYAPLQFWKGERTEVAAETFRDPTANQRFVLPATKQIIRVEDDEPLPPPAKRRRTRPTANTSAKRAAAATTAALHAVRPEPLEPWERNPGVVDGEVLLWTPSHETDPPGPDEEFDAFTMPLAIAGAAVQTREIKDAGFRYAKTLSMGFMGTGIVDLPPGSEKKPKNSRRMQLVFFIVTGKVLVTVHDNEFRIGAGGQFFVPRGNYYSIVNDYDSPARVFFAQACEMEQQPEQQPGGEGHGEEEEEEDEEED